MQFQSLCGTRPKPVFWFLSFEINVILNNKISCLWKPTLWFIKLFASVLIAILARIKYSMFFMKNCSIVLTFWPRNRVVTENIYYVEKKFQELVNSHLHTRCHDFSFIFTAVVSWRYINSLAQSWLFSCAFNFFCNLYDICFFNHNPACSSI